MLRGVDKEIATPNVADIMKLVLMIGDIRLLEEQKGVAGDVYIFDASVATPGHFAKFTPAIVKKFLICVQEAYPVKLKEMHIINVSPLVDTIINFVRPFLKEKIRQRIHFHSNIESLYKFVPKVSSFFVMNKQISEWCWNTVFIGNATNWIWRWSWKS